MNGSAVISVVIPARNAAATIETALGSLLSDKPLIREILLIDDGSDDGTADIALQTARRLGLPMGVVSTRLGSAGAARNAGISRARGDFIFFLDADDAAIPGSLSALRSALAGSGAGLAIGASIRRTKGRPDKVKTPHGYGPDRRLNTSRYLRNELWPIAMGSALVANWATAGIRFPETIGLDEDTCYWASVLARTDAVTIDTPVLFYHHDEERMARRFITAPRKTFLAIARELNGLAAAGVGREALQWRKAWIAQRIARQLIKHGMFADAAGMMRAVKTHKELGRRWKALQYRARIGIGQLAKSRPSLPDPAAPRRTLIISVDPAYPPVSGADLRTFGNAAAAAEFGPVCLASVRPPAGPERPHGIRMACLTTGSDKRSRSLGWGRIKGEVRIPRLALARLEALVRAFRPDTIVVESIPLFKLLRPLRPLTGQLILDMQNVESDLAVQMLPGNDRLAISPDIRRLERKAAEIADRIWVCSRTDRERFKTIAANTVRVDVVPNGIPRAEALPRTLPASPGLSDGFPVILFVGHLGYGPNVDAAERLAGAILPRIRHALPRARLILAGRSPNAAARALPTRDGVTLVADPHDVGLLLSAAHLCIVPLRMGGGTRVKILEAMAYGVPVIATPLAAEGLDLTDGQDLLLSDTDEGLAELAIELCSDPDRMAGLRACAHDTVWSRFGPQAIRDAVRHGLGLDATGR
ncbi:glycosyltransferase [Mesorhizobium sp. BH1-1-5]|uniref:glycosyltransferase n=1 Tax=Mesorhizobium sp. BH1-1-5 TaxID=2876661 RepID=UPI001CCF636D|nr:glycosyltransferase [Mesorhizobium sp. BH1-1-5]MBZ9987446.1 glycosyltransferase [Mesorhizobium sp. BH1-1-5]